MNVNETTKSSVEHSSLEQDEKSEVVACGGIIIRKDMGTVTGRCNECGGHEGSQQARKWQRPGKRQQPPRPRQHGRRCACS